jgi:hypothetical protein
MSSEESTKEFLSLINVIIELMNKLENVEKLVQEDPKNPLNELLGKFDELENTDILFKMKQKKGLYECLASDSELSKMSKEERFAYFRGLVHATYPKSITKYWPEKRNEKNPKINTKKKPIVKKVGNEIKRIEKKKK